MSKPANYTSHTELSTLARCEESWYLRYVEGVKGEAGPAAQTGTLVHLGAAAYNRGDDWRRALAEAITEEGADASLVGLDALDPETPASLAAWLLGRYERHYARPDEVVAQELDLLTPLVDSDGNEIIHQAIIDEVWRLNGELWAVERKTYGRNDRQGWVEVDPQLTLNLWAVRQAGYDAVGIIFDGIYTYRWKPEKPTLGAIEEKLVECGFQGTKKDLREQARAVQADESNWTERPDSETFDRLWLDRHQEHTDAALDSLLAAVDRRTALRDGARPVRNIGTTCRSCDQRSACWEMLAFPQDIQLDAD